MFKHTQLPADLVFGAWLPTTKTVDHDHKNCKIIWVQRIIDVIK